MEAKGSKSRVDVVTLLYVVGFLDLFGVSMVIPMLSTYLTKELGASPAMTGILGSLYGGLQLVSSPLVGKWSDISGRRFTLLICLVISCLGYLGISQATVLWMAFVARVPLGIFKHSLSISRAYLADIVPKVEQAKVFGRFNAYSSIGFIVGPSVGGHLSEWPGGFKIVTFLGATLFLLNAVMVWVFLPESKAKPHPALTRDESVTSLRQIAADEINFNPFQFIKSFQLIDWSVLWDIFTLRFLLSFALIVYRSNFSLTMMHNYDATAKTIGYIISYTALVSAASGFLCGKISTWYKSDEKLLLHCTILLFFSILGTTFSPNLYLFLAFTAPMSLFNSVSRICVTNITISKAHGHDNGALMGLGQSVISIARIISPALAGILQEGTMSGPGMVASVLCFIAACIMIVCPLDRQLTKKKDKKHN